MSKSKTKKPTIKAQLSATKETLNAALKYIHEELHPRKVSKTAYPSFTKQEGKQLPNLLKVESLFSVVATADNLGFDTKLEADGEVVHVVYVEKQKPVPLDVNHALVNYLRGE